MNEQKIARVTTAAELLKAGFTPKGADLVHDKSGASVSQALLNQLSGRVVPVEETGVEEFPAIYGTTILPAAAVALVARKTKVKTVGGVDKEITLFTDGAVMLWDASIVTGKDAALLAGGMAPALPLAQ